MIGRMLVGLAVVGGTLAPFAGSPYRADHVSLDGNAVAQALTTEQGTVTAVDLAEWIRARKPGLRILDVGDGEYLLPGAEFVPLASLATATQSLSATAPLVLYSSGSHGDQAWALLRAQGFRQAYSLRGGLDAWLSDVMHPTVSASASPGERAAFERVADLSRYFGGQPMVTEGGSVPTTAARRRAPGRRGC